MVGIRGLARSSLIASIVTLFETEFLVSVLVEAEQDTKLADHVIGYQLLFSLMSISAEEILAEFVLILVYIEVSFKQSESEEVSICQVVEDCISEDLKLFIVNVHIEETFG